MKMEIVSKVCSRREFLQRTGAVTIATAAGPLAIAASKREEIDYPRGKAEHCIFIWLGGGAAHIDTWDPKRVGDFKKAAGSAYPPIETALSTATGCRPLKTW